MPSEPVLVGTSGTACDVRVARAGRRAGAAGGAARSRACRRAASTAYTAGASWPLEEKQTSSPSSTSRCSQARMSMTLKRRADVARAGLHDRRQRVDPAGVGERRRRASTGSLDRADALELGRGDVAQLDRRVGGERGGFHQTSGSARGSRAAISLGALEVVGVVDREALVALGEERDDALRRRSRRRPRSASRRSRARSPARRRPAATRSGASASAPRPGLLQQRAHEVAVEQPHLPRVLADLADGADRVGAVLAEQRSKARSDRRRRCGTGYVGRRIEKSVVRRRPSSAWRTHSMSGEVEPAISGGRRTGTSAP